MSYGLKYTMQVEAKTEPTQIVYTCQIYEKDYAGADYTMDNANAPFRIDSLASSDDQFDPVLASTFTILADVTDFTNDLPDFTTTDDRKYWVKFYGNGTSFLVWQGFIIMEQVTIPFTTGRTFLQMVCSDGLAMLKNIPYEPSDSDINLIEDLSTVITNCLNKIELPDGYNVNYGVNIYAVNYDTTPMNTAISPFKQMYYAPRNWLKEVPTVDQTGNPFASPYISCYDVLTAICEAFGAQVFQSNGEYWIQSVAERAANILRFYQTTNENGTPIGGFARWKHIEVEPYADANTTPWYFQDNIQAKIIRKGYKDFQFTCPAEYAPQMLDNGSMSVINVGFPKNFGFNEIGSFTLTSLGPYNAVNLQPTGGGPTQRTPTLTALSIAKAVMGERMNLSFWIDGQATPDPAKPKTWLYVYLYKIVGMTLTEYWLDKDKNWQTVETKIEVFGTTSSAYESVSFNSNNFPIDGTLSIYWVCDNFDTYACTIGNVILSFTSQYDYRLITTSFSDTTYTKSVDLQIGGPSDQFNISQKGSLVGADGNYLTAWYRLGKTEAFDELMRIIIQQYYDILSTGQINFNCTIRNLYDRRSNPGILTHQYPHILGIVDGASVEDSTTNSLSVDGKFYIIGAASYDFYNDIFNGTLLYTSQTELTTTFFDKVIVNPKP